MRSIFLCLFLVLGPVSFTFSQCAIYVCTETGAWAASYQDGTPPFLNMTDTKKQAYDECVKSGGRNCTFFYSAECNKCWWAFIIGYDDTSFNYMANYSYISQEDAVKTLKEAYKANGGVGYYSAKVTTWYMP